MWLKIMAICDFSRNSAAFARTRLQFKSQPLNSTPYASWQPKAAQVFRTRWFVAGASPAWQFSRRKNFK